jgi:hypothetical protein
LSARHVALGGFRERKVLPLIKNMLNTSPEIESN